MPALTAVVAETARVAPVETPRPCPPLTRARAFLHLARELPQFPWTPQALRAFDAAFRSLDLEGLWREERGRYSYLVWDKRTPVNNVPREAWFSHPGNPGDAGEHYFVYRDGRLAAYQYHALEAGYAPLRDAPGHPHDVHAQAEAHLDALAEPAWRDRVLEALIEALLAATVATTGEPVSSARLAEAPAPLPLPARRRRP